MKSLKIWLILFSIGFLQCGKSSDYSQGPTSSGGEVRIHLLSVVYQPDKGAVLIQWDQTGDAGKGNFHIQRKEGAGDFVEIGQKAADDSDSEAGVFSFFDTEALAGELMSYRVALRLEDKWTYPSNVLKTQMPGARLLDVRLDPESAAVQIRWTPDVEQGMAYEIVRRIGEDSEAVVYRTMDAGSKEFVDGPIVGNEVHAYWIRTLTQGGAKLESRSQQTGFYLASYSTQFTIIPGTSVRLALDNYDSNTTRSLLCVVEASGYVTMHRKTFYPPESRVFPPGGPPTFDEASIYLNEEPALVPASISVAGSSVPVLWNPVSLQLDALRAGYTFVAGIDPQTQAVHIKFFSTNSSGWVFQFRKSYPYLSEPPVWQVDSTDRIAMTQEFAKRHDKYNHWRLYVVAGGTLKIFNFFQFMGLPRRAEVVEVWSEPIQATTPPYDLLFWKNALWMSFPDEHRLVKAQIDFGSEEPQHITYRDIPLMDGIQPSALTVNFSGQLCVLDMHNSKIWILNQEGDPITHIEVKGPGFVQDGRLNGDLVSGLEELQDVLYLLRPSGILTILKTEMQ